MRTEKISRSPGLAAGVIRVPEAAKGSGAHGAPYGSGLQHWSAEHHSAAGFLRLSGALPSSLTSADGLPAGRGPVLRLGAAAFFGSFLSVFFFLLPAALPEALRFFGPW